MIKTTARTMLVVAPLLSLVPSARAAEFSALPGEDVGYSFFRELVDVNGDGRADFCRLVGGCAPYLTCLLAHATNSAFTSNELVHARHGPSETCPPRGEARPVYFDDVADVDGDGQGDYCRLKDNHLSCFLAGNDRFIVSEWGPRTTFDTGHSYMRSMADVNRDGKADFCRFIGHPKTPYLSCLIGDELEFSTTEFRSQGPVDIGYSYMRVMADVNDDNRSDYCRFVGDVNRPMLSCLLADSTGFGTRTINSAGPIDKGYSFLRTMADINGDGRADFCRFVGSSRNPSLSCLLASPIGFAPEHVFSQGPVDKGYSWMRGMADVNGDGRSDFCRFVGQSNAPILSCLIAEGGP